EYHQHSSPSVYVKFPLKSDPASIDPALAGRKIFALIWTTTPWTLPANLGIAVHPDFEYVVIESGGEAYLVAAELVDVVVAKCNLEAPKYWRAFRARSSIAWKRSIRGSVARRFLWLASTGRSAGKPMPKPNSMSATRARDQRPA